jgi:hypothetical protein
MEVNKKALVNKLSKKTVILFPGVLKEVLVFHNTAAYLPFLKHPRCWLQ